MKLGRRHLIAIVALALYWPGLFIATHLRHVPGWVRSIGASDKTMHYLAYFGLSILYWFAISPYKKVNWRKAGVWWAILIVVVYGIADEFLQHFSHRNPDFRDFLANLIGALTGFILLSIFGFWHAIILLIGIGTFVLTGLAHVTAAFPSRCFDVAFYFLLYAALSFLWIQYLKRVFKMVAPGLKWFITSLSLPLGMLLAVRIFCIIDGQDFELLNDIVAILALGIITAFYYTLSAFGNETSKFSVY